MRVRTSGRRGGFTLIELVLVAALLSVFLGSTVVLGRSVLGAFRSETTVARQDEALQLALDRMAQRLRAVDGQALQPGAVASSSWIEFQRASDHDGTDLLWGELERLLFEREEGEADDGLDNDGDGLVDEGRVVWLRDPGGPDERRVVLATSVPELGPGETAADGLDDDGDGLVDEGGVCFVVSGGRMRILLTLAWRDDAGLLQQASAERIVVMRNTGVNAP